MAFENEKTNNNGNSMEIVSKYKHVSEAKFDCQVILKICYILLTIAGSVVIQDTWEKYPIRNT